MSGSNVAPVKWAQRKDSLYITISLPDVTDHSIELTEKKIVFSGVSGGQAYKLDLELVSTELFMSSFLCCSNYNQWIFACAAV